ncbi:uncharacterized protein LOC123197701 [Mangifera indica]|uniref:uncharacterized protein LOC123197701 n=1 Tax=Mangifera indica TaxID=29780 RepID=UPI001CFAAD21|nr:uncharacterized protein LOC123197701 [Mangifera indica]
MEKVAETPLRSPEQAENTLLELKTPLQNGQTDEQIPQESGNELKKTNTPDRLKVPKAFKYTERYRSPTDSMMSPVSKGLLARNRKGAVLLPPSISQPKIQELLVQEVGLFQN